MRNSIGGEIVELRIKSFHLFRGRPFATLPLALIRTRDRNDPCRVPFGGLASVHSLHASNYSRCTLRSQSKRNRNVASLI